MDPQFAYVSDFYDVLMKHVSYEGWVDYILSRVAEMDRKPEWVLDVACGTGNPTILLAERGVRVTGVDRSLDMVRLAVKKARDKGLAIPFFVQDMRELSLTRKADVILCLYDSLNFLLTEMDIRQAFAAAAKHLKPGGLYVFDVVTERNILNHFNGHVYKGEKKGFAYQWTNEYDQGTQICTSHLTGYSIRNGQKCPFHELHRERIYPASVLEIWLQDAGLTVKAVRQAFMNAPPSPTSNRIHFECTVA